MELIDQAPRTGLFGLEVAFVHPDAVHGVLDGGGVPCLTIRSASSSPSTAGRSSPRRFNPTRPTRIERALAAGAGGTVQLDTEDGRLSVVVPRVVYLKRYPPGSQVGFGA